jgi:hypothetical protein
VQNALINEQRKNAEREIFGCCGINFGGGV